MPSCKQEDSQDYLIGISGVTLTKMKDKIPDVCDVLTKTIKNKMLFLKSIIFA